MTRTLTVLAGVLLACARRQSPEQCAQMQPGDCAGPLREERLNPHLSIGPADEATQADPLLAAAPEQRGTDLDLAWRARDPDVIVGTLQRPSLDLASGEAGAAANGAGDPAKVAACEKLLGEPAGAGIPVP